jgi:hypothetical protein
MTNLHCTPELAAFLDARRRADEAQAGFAAALARLKALDARPEQPRRSTLIGVAPPSRPLTQQRAAFVAAALGMRPSGRY